MRSKKQEEGSRKQEAGSWELGAGSWEMALQQTQCDNNERWEQEARSKRKEYRE